MTKITLALLGVSFLIPTHAQGAILPIESGLIANLESNLPIELTLLGGELGIPNPNTYLSDFLGLFSQVPSATLFGGDFSPTTLANLLSSLDSTDSGILFDLAVDGNVIYSQEGTGFKETVVAPIGLEERYYRLGTAEIVTQGAIDLGLSEEAQLDISNILAIAQTNNAASNNQASLSDETATDSGQRTGTLSQYQQGISSLASSSAYLASASQNTDTSFQILRNISQQLGYQAEQESQQAAQTAELGQILANQSEQAQQQSQQFSAQQETATQMLETAKQQQVLQAMEASATGLQLELLTETTTEQNRLSNAAFRHAQSGVGVILIPRGFDEEAQ
ncbi:MAG: hypothetical protein AB4058_06460 [Microcystaceae cyanobacterium]